MAGRKEGFPLLVGSVSSCLRAQKQVALEELQQELVLLTPSCKLQPVPNLAVAVWSCGGTWSRGPTWPDAA